VVICGKPSHETTEAQSESFYNEVVGLWFGVVASLDARKAMFERSVRP
jgi:hypothetical protein